MKLSILDGNKELAEFNVELDRNMFIVTPKIYDDKFIELRNEIRLIRVRYMTKYLNYIEYDKTEESAKRIEQEIIDEIRSIALRELGYFNKCEGYSYYIRVGN